MNDADAEKHAEIVRKLIEHENALQNFRFTWFSTSQAFLLTALGFAWEKATTFVVCVICVVGIMTTFAAFVALRLSDLAYVQLGQWWEKNLATYQGPPRQGYEGQYSLMRAMPSRLLPWVFMIAWIILVIYRVGFYQPESTRLTAPASSVLPSAR